MGYQCGACKAPLDEKMLDSGVCPSCGARISPFGDVIRAANAAQPEQEGSWGEDIPLIADRADPFDPPTLADAHRLPITKLDRLSIARANHFGLRLPPEQSPPDRATTLSLLIGVSIAAIMVMVCALTVVLTTLNGFNSPPPAQGNKTTIIRHTPQATSNPNDLGFATQVADPTPLPYYYATPTLAPTTTPFGGGTATPSASQTPGSGPMLYYTLDNQPKPGQCFLNGGFSSMLSITFNPGPGLPWSIDPKSANYSYTSTAGTGNYTITVSHITKSGTIIINAPGAQHGSPPVNVNCTLP